MRNQVYVMGRFELSPDEAFVVDVSDGGAEYFTVPLGNIWGTTLDIVDRTGSLNKAQSAPNEDGTYTYVISAVDPGLQNWIDTDGLNEGILTLRMAEFGGTAQRGPGCAGPGGEARRSRQGSADAAKGHVAGAGRRARRPAHRLPPPAAGRGGVRWHAG